MSDYLQRQIETRRSRIATLDRERVALVAELTAYEDALANAADGSIQSAIPKSHRPQHRLLPVSRAWRLILHRLVDFRHFNGGDVKLVAQELYDESVLRKPQTNDGVRAQLSLYARKGIIKRLGGGNYRLTEGTKAALALPNSALDAHPDHPDHDTKLAWAKARDSGPSHGG
jgi:hypothetical protein